MSNLYAVEPKSYVSLDEGSIFPSTVVIPPTCNLAIGFTFPIPTLPS